MKDKYDEFIDKFDGKGYDRKINLYYTNDGSWVTKSTNLMTRSSTV